MNNPYPAWTERAMYGVLLLAAAAVPLGLWKLWELVTQ